MEEEEEEEEGLIRVQLKSVDQKLVTAVLKEDSSKEQTCVSRVMRTQGVGKYYVTFVVLFEKALPKLVTHMFNNS